MLAIQLYAVCLSHNSYKQTCTSSHLSTIMALRWIGLNHAQQYMPSWFICTIFVSNLTSTLNYCDHIFYFGWRVEYGPKSDLLD